jgi:acyl-CoA carboxylase subunit beta
VPDPLVRPEHRQPGSVRPESSSAPLLGPPVVSNLDTRSANYTTNREQVLAMLAEIDRLLEEAAAGGGPKAHARLKERGKLPVRERIALALDPDSPFLEISPLAAYDSDYTIGGGAVIGIGVIADVEVVIFAYDPSVLGGAMTPYVVKKWRRALEIARDNRIPFVSFVESAGADLRKGDDEETSGRKPAKVDHFAESGRFFYEMTELSKFGIPLVCVVFGSSTAGGAYQPGLSDYNIFVKGQSKVFLAGPPLVKMATGEDSDDETLGGAQMHAETSGLADYMAEDERDALRICREVVSHLNWRKQGTGPTLLGDAPVLEPDELLGVVGADLKLPVDVRDVIGRVVDGSRFEEFKPLYGPTMVCGWSSIHGYPIGILGNNGVIFPEAAEKGAHFIQLCNQQDVPLLFLQNITGFMVGKDYEQAGIVKKGSQLVNAVSNSMVPHLTVIIGSSFGAGTYGMSGRAFGNRFTFIWPSSKIAVMGPKQIAGVMSIVRRGQAARAGIPFDDLAVGILVERAEAEQEAESVALQATGAISDDGIIDPRDTRDVLGFCLSVVQNRPVQGATGYGVFRL